MQHNLADIEQQLILLTRQFLLEQETTRAVNTVNLDASLERQIGIDSLGKVALFARIEKAYGVSFPDAVIAQADTLRDIAKATLAATPRHTFKHREFAPTVSNVTIDVATFNTLPDALIQYAMHEPQRPHIYLHHDTGQETLITYGLLLSNASSIANSLIAKGIKPHDTIAIMLPTSEAFFASFFGVLLAGAIPVPIYPPFRADRIEEYAIREALILNNAEVRLLITFSQAERLSHILKSYIPSLLDVVTATHLLTGKGGLPQIERSPDDAALIQYTSGSTGDPKGVLLLHRNIIANIKSAVAALALQPLDNVVSWLPLYHDMGLMSWIGSLFYGMPITIMSPLTFLNHPERWLWTIHYHRGTISAAPNFAYELCLKKIEDDRIEGLDLSSWRLALNGAEAVNPRTMHAFYQRFKAYGLSNTTLFPVYGLAENTVGLAFPPLNREPRVDKIDRTIFENELRAVPCENHNNYLEFLSEGMAIPDHEIRIVDDHNQVRAERHVGNIQFRGPSAMQGYYQNPTATAKVYHDGWWDTGDLGYMVDGELFVSGRKKDIIIKAGRNLYPETIEEMIGNIHGVRKGCVIALGIIDTQMGTEKIIIVAESKLTDADALQKLQAMIIEQVAVQIGLPPDEVIIVAAQTIPKTSSGKLQRSACKHAYLSGTLTQKPRKVWWQIIKLYAIARVKRIKRFGYQCAKLLYTSYMACLLLITIIPVWLASLMTPHRTTACILKYWAYIYFKLSFCPLKIISPKKLTRTTQAIYVANHASYSDSLLLLAILPAGTLFIAKKELFKLPIIASIMKKLHYISVDRWY